MIWWRSAAGSKRPSLEEGGCRNSAHLPHEDIRNVVVGVALGDPGQEQPEWEYEIAFTQDNRQRPVIKRETVKKQGQRILNRPNPEDAADVERLHQSYIEQVNVNREFRPLADFLRTVRYVHLVPQLVRETERYVGKGQDPFGSDFLEQIAIVPEKTRSSRLRKIGDALKVAVPQLQDLEFYRDPANGTPHLRGKYEHWRPLGAWQNEGQFSDGTLRLLGLLWAVLDRSGPLLLEEPELNLHPEVIRYLPQMFATMQRRAGRQVIISTHSSDLLRDEGIGLDEVLLLKPQDEGTTVELAKNIRDAENLVQGGIPLPDVLLPATDPPKARQLALFGE